MTTHKFETVLLKQIKHFGPSHIDAINNIIGTTDTTREADQKFVNTINQVLSLPDDEYEQVVKEWKRIGDENVVPGRHNLTRAINSLKCYQTRKKDSNFLNRAFDSSVPEHSESVQNLVNIALQNFVNQNSEANS